MKRFIAKYLLVPTAMLIAAVSVWGFIVCQWFHGTVYKSLMPVVANAQNASPALNAPSLKDFQSGMNLYFSELEKSGKIAAYSFLNEDKTAERMQEPKKKDGAFPVFNLLYPVTAGDKITGYYNTCR